MTYSSEDERADRAFLVGVYYGRDQTIAWAEEVIRLHVGTAAEFCRECHYVPDQELLDLDDSERAQAHQIDLIRKGRGEADRLLALARERVKES